MNKFYTLVLLVFVVSFCDAQYVFKIEDLNTRFDYKLKVGKRIYYQNKKSNDVVKDTFKGATSDVILLEKNKVKPSDISWISLHKYHDNAFRIWCRNSIPNLHLAKKPNYDLETSHLAEIVSDTTTLNVDSNSFATPTNKQLLRMYLPQLVYNFKQQVLSPFRASGAQWGVTLASAVVFYTALKLDKSVNDNVYKKLGNTNSFITSNKYVSQLGGNVGIGFVGCWLAGGLIFKNSTATETALMATQAMITATVWNRVLKYSTLRERPYSATANNTSELNLRGPKELKKLWNNSDYHSLGSGHTANAFAIATVFAEQYKETPWVAVGAYTSAFAVGASRVALHKHWTSDVLIGALLGFACGKQITSFKKTYYIKKATKFGINTTLASVYVNNKQYPAISITALVK